MAARDLPARILKRAAKASVEIPPEVAAQAARYLELLAKWNEKINLTALHVDPPNDEAVDRLVVEPFVALRYFRPEDRVVVDVGSGGGSPALPLKIARPDLHFVLVESKVRKAAFLREAVRQLQLPNVEVENRRLEDLAARDERRGRADVVTLRAVRLDAERVRVLASLLRPGGRLFAFAGPGFVASVLKSTADVQTLLPWLQSRLVMAEVGQ